MLKYCFGSVVVVPSAAAANNHEVVALAVARAFKVSVVLAFQGAEV